MLACMRADVHSRRRASGPGRSPTGFDESRRTGIRAGRRSPALDHALGNSQSRTCRHAGMQGPRSFDCTHACMCACMLRNTGLIASLYDRLQLQGARVEQWSRIADSVANTCCHVSLVAINELTAVVKAFKTRLERVSTPLAQQLGLAVYVEVEAMQTTLTMLTG